MKTNFRFLSLIFVLIAGTQLMSLSAQEREEATLRVLSYNVHHCNPPSKPGFIDLKAVAKVINDVKPDLVALQEIDVYTERSGKESHQAKELAEQTGMYYSFVKAIDFQGGEYGIAILSRFPFDETRSFKLPMVEGVGGESRCVAAVAVNLPCGKEIAFACTHLDLPEENRKAQIGFITDQVKELKYNIPVIIAGDFNAFPDSYVVSELDKLFQRTCTDCPFTIPEINPDRTIDYIAFSPKTAFTVVKHEVIAEPYASDHLPVMAEIKLNN